MDDERENSKKRVSFGKARVRLIYDYYEQNSRENEVNDEMKSRETAEIKRPPFQRQKQPKSILKSSTRALSLDSGLNTLHRRPFEWETQERNFWIPTKYSSRENKLSEKYDLFKTDDQTKEKDHAKVMRANDVASEKDEAEKPMVKNNEKWEGITQDKAQGLTPQTLGIYSGVEADWDQTKQLLWRTGVDVGESRLQNPR